MLHQTSIISEIKETKTHFDQNILMNWYHNWYNIPPETKVYVSSSKNCLNSKNLDILSNGKCDTDVDVIYITKVGRFYLHNLMYLNCENMDTWKT